MTLSKKNHKVDVAHLCNSLFFFSFTQSKRKEKKSLFNLNFSYAKSILQGNYQRFCTYIVMQN